MTRGIVYLDSIVTKDTDESEIRHPRPNIDPTPTNNTKHAEDVPRDAFARLWFIVLLVDRRRLHGVT